MRVKKSIFGCIIWILFVGIIIASISQNLFVFSTEIPQKMWLTEGMILACILVATIGVLLIIRHISFQIQKKWTPTMKHIHIVEAVGVIILLLFIFGIRIYYVMQGYASIIENEYYTSAIVGNSHDTTTYSTLSNVYIYLLSFIFSLLGNKIIIGVYFQLILQGIGIILIYFTVKNINGRMNGFFVAVVLAVWKPIVSSITEYSTIHFLFFIIAVAMWYMTFLWKIILQGRSNLILRSMLLLLAGIMTGFVCYMDIFGVYLLIMCMVGLFLYRSALEVRTVKGVVPAAIGYALCSIVSFFSFQWVGAIINGTDFITVITTFGNSIVSHFYFEFKTIFLPVQFEVSMGILFVAASWAVGYWLAKKDENLLYILLLLCALGDSFFIHNEVHYELLVQTSWILVAVTSTISLCTCYMIKQEHQQIDKNQQVDKDQQVDKEQQVDIKLQADVDKQVTVEMQPDTFVPIPNPLPLPKKHVHKEMDYEMEIEESQMHYDLEQISENDDFDLK